MILVGGGVIGCEIGQFLKGMGTEMTIVEALPRLMATMDEDVSKQIARQFKKDKIKVICGDGIAEVIPGDNSATVIETEKEARNIAINRREQSKLNSMQNKATLSLDDLFSKIKEGVKEINVLVKADVNGSSEAVKNALEKIDVEGVRVKVVSDVP